MESLIQKIVNSLRQKGLTDIRLFENEILSQEPKDFLVACFTNEDIHYRYMNEILLIFTDLWKDFNLDDWREIMRRIDRPKGYRPLFDDTGHFEDVKFLLNWIEIDSIELYQNDPEISEKNKKVLDKVIPLFLFSPTKGVDFMEDFEDGTYGNYQHLVKMRERLIKQGAKPIAE